jgi:hypothetical protein
MKNPIQKNNLYATPKKFSAFNRKDMAGHYHQCAGPWAMPNVPLNVQRGVRGPF